MFDEKDLVPDVEKFLLKFADGTVGVMQFVTDDKRGLVQKATRENVQHEIDKLNASFANAENEQTRAKVPVLGFSKLADGVLPDDRVFRNAWRHSGAKIKVDMAHARELHRENLRVIRAPLLDALDVDYFRAEENGDVDKKREIIQRKQSLRDITDHPEIDAAKTPEALKNAAIDVINEGE